MSRASKYVEWCIKKAKKESEECVKLGKRIKHRGLLKINSNIEESKKHIKKAEHDFSAVSKFNKGGYSDWSITAGFYCIYHCFLAIAIKFGYESKNQACTVALIEYLKESNKINIDNKFIEMLKYHDMEEIQKNVIIEEREFYIYGTETSVKDKTKINSLIKNCKEIIDLTKEIVFK